MVKRHTLKPDHKKIVLCEGPSDAAFLRRLREEKLIPHSVACMEAGQHGPGQGVSGMKTFLEALPAFDKERQIETICLLADADYDCEAQFQLLVQQIEAANRNEDTKDLYSVPTRLGSFASENRINLHIELVPANDKIGTLETLLLTVLNDVHSDKMKCVDTLINCSGNTTWSPNQVAKARVQAALAIILETDPACGLSRLWSDHPDVIPVNHTAFRDLVDRLAREI